MQFCGLILILLFVFLQRSVLGRAGFQEGEEQACHVDSNRGSRVVQLHSVTLG